LKFAALEKKKEEEEEEEKRLEGDFLIRREKRNSDIEFKEERSAISVGSGPLMLLNLRKLKEECMGEWEGELGNQAMRLTAFQVSKDSQFRLVKLQKRSYPPCTFEVKGWRRTNRV